MGSEMCIRDRTMVGTDEIVSLVHWITRMTTKPMALDQILHKTHSKMTPGHYSAICGGYFSSLHRLRVFSNANDFFAINQEGVLNCFFYLFFFLQNFYSLGHTQFESDFIML